MMGEEKKINENIVQPHHGSVNYSDSTFENLGLTNKNQDFMFQLNKHIGNNLATDTKKAALDEVVSQLKAAQGKGQTAKQLFGTPSEKAQQMLHPEKRATNSTVQAGYWANVLDTALMFFAMFSAVFGFFLLTANGKIQTQGTPYGILSLLLTATTGGLIFAYIQQLLVPINPKDKKPLWFRLVFTLGAIAVWMFVYIAVTAIPSAINPILPGYVYLALAVVAFVGFIFERRITGITGGVFDSSKRHNQK